MERQDRASAATVEIDEQGFDDFGRRVKKLHRGISIYSYHIAQPLFRAICMNITQDYILILHTIIIYTLSYIIYYR